MKRWKFKKRYLLIGAGVVVVLAVIGRAEAVVLGIAALLAVGSLATARRLNRSYVGALAQSLENGVVRLADAEVFDSATRRTLAESATVGRAALLARIEERELFAVAEHRAQLVRGHERAEDLGLGCFRCALVHQGRACSFIWRSS